MQMGGCIFTKKRKDRVHMKITYQKVVKGLRYLKHYGFKEFLIRLQERMEEENIPYEQWYERHKATEEQLKKQKEIVKKWNEKPLISIVVPCYQTPEKFLLALIESVKNQTYDNWQLCLADGSRDDEVSKVVFDMQNKDSRICYKHLEENLGIAENTNAAIAMAKGDCIAFLDHDDLLAPDALFEVVARIIQGCDMVYTDEDKVEMDGNTHFQPHLKPDFNVDLLRSNNYITHFLVVKKSIVEKVGGIRKDFDGAQDYDFILRCSEIAQNIGHVPRILYHWRCHQASTADNPFSKQYAVDAGKRAIEEHLRRTGDAGTVTAKKDMGFYSVQYKVKDEPLVSIIIPSKDEVESLKKCLASIEKSSYTNYEVIVVENNSNESTFEFYREIASDNGNGGCYEGTLASGQRLCIAVWKDGFNYSKLNNFGATYAKGEYFVLLNNDIEIISEDWLEEMLANSQRKNVGIVGAKLYYPDDTIQHAGVVVGIGGNARGIADNMFVGMQRSRSGYMHKASIQLNYSAVTAACLMVKSEVYKEVSGFEETLAVAFNDVDFCLKVREKGYLVVYNPKVEAYHYESKSRGAEDSPEKIARFQKEIEYMRNHWIHILKNGDPYYNPNFSSVYNNYSLKDNS